MPFQAATDIAETEVRMVWAGVPVEYVFHWIKQDGTPWSAEDIQNLASVAFAAASDFFAPLIADDNTLNSVLAKDLTEAIDDVFEYFPGSPVPGVLTGQPVANMVAICVTHRTGMTGRSARGRTYHGGFTEEQTVINSLESVYAGQVSAAFDDFFEALLTEDYVAVVLSRRTAGAPRFVGIPFIITSTGLRNTRLDTQRRRMPADS